VLTSLPETNAWLQVFSYRLSEPFCVVCVRRTLLCRTIFRSSISSTKENKTTKHNTIKQGVSEAL
jgi:hypothetical protein